MVSEIPRVSVHSSPTSFPSSAPVDRLFSYSGQINNPERGHLTDFKFRNIVMLKTNYHLFKFVL